MKCVPLCLWFSLLLTGCNWAHLMEFRAQMGKSREFLAWETRATEAVLVFRKPVLTIADLQAAGLHAERLDEVRAVIRYNRVDGPKGDPTNYDIRLLLADGRLSGVIFPQALCDGLGKENIVGILAMMGDRENRDAGMSPLPRERLVSAGLADVAQLASGTAFTLVLEPRDRRNRSISLRLAESNRPGSFSSFHLKLI